MARLIQAARPVPIRQIARPLPVAKPAPVSMKQAARLVSNVNKSGGDMGLKLKISKKSFNQVMKVGAGAISGAAMGGPFGAGAGVLTALTGKGKASPADLLKGAADGSIVGFATGKGIAGEILAPKAQELFSKAKGALKKGKQVIKEGEGAFAGASSAVKKTGSMSEKVEDFMADAGAPIDGKPSSMKAASLLSGDFDIKKYLPLLVLLGLGIAIVKR